VATFAGGAGPEQHGEGDLPSVPLYENHTPGAQGMWESLKGRHVVQEITKEEAGGRQMHAELGMAGELTYLYCANTFDQRQLVMVERGRTAVVEEYYEEIVGSKGESPS
jgi:hypothetical protein